MGLRVFALLHPFRNRSISDETREFDQVKHRYQNIPGWFDWHNLYSAAARELPHGSSIVEVGAWLGRSTSFLATEIHNYGKSMKLYVVDHWRGSVDEWDMIADATSMNVADLFNKNMVGLEYIPICGSSVNSADLFKDGSIEFVFLDGSHDRESVLDDIAAWAPKVKRGGILAGHDYNRIDSPQVIEAVDKSQRRGLIGEYRVFGHCWIARMGAPVGDIDYEVSLAKCQ